MLKNRDERLKARLTSWLVEQRRLGVEYPEITEHTITEIERRRDLTVHERADRLLQYFEKQTSHIGEVLSFYVAPKAVVYPAEKILLPEDRIERLDDHISKGHQNNWKMMAWSECTKDRNFDEAKFLLEYAKREGWIEYDPVNESCTLTVEGYAHLAELGESSYRFITSLRGYVVR